MPYCMLGSDGAHFFALFLDEFWKDAKFKNLNLQTQLRNILPSMLIEVVLSTEQLVTDIAIEHLLSCMAYDMA